MSRKTKVVIEIILENSRVRDLHDTIEDFKNTHNVGYSFIVTNEESKGDKCDDITSYSGNVCDVCGTKIVEDD